MKTFRFFFLVSLSLFSISCSNRIIEEPKELLKDTGAYTKADASSFSSVNFNFSVKEKDIWVFIERQKEFPLVVSINPIVREGDTLLYIANLEKGWKVFSADKHLPPILAEIPEGSFGDKTLDNPGIRAWMDSMTDLTSDIRQEKELSSATDFTDLWEGYPVTKKETRENNGIRGLSMEPTWTRAVIYEQTVLDTITYGPLLSTKWGQRTPWNNSLPIYQGSQHYPTGCAAVAISQILYYYHDFIDTPSGLFHDISISNWIYNSGIDPYYTSVLSRQNYQEPSSRWAQMVKDTVEYNTYYPSSITGASYVSDLMVDVGNRTSMKYYADGSKSGAQLTGELSALSSFGLDYNYSTFNINTAYTELANSRPILINGVDSSNNAGHAWVIDGAKKSQYITYITYQWWMGYLAGSLPNGEEMTQSQAQEAAWEIGLDKPADGMITYGVSYTEPYYQFYMNWGWDGSSDGLYFYNGLVLHNNQYYHFSDNQYIIYSFHAHTGN